MKPLQQALLSAEELTPSAARSLVEMAASLRRAAEHGVEQPLLRGKNIALLCSDPASRTANDFQRAATRLGARVSPVPPHPSLLDAQGGGARMLARLYDAIECEGLSREDAQRLQRLAGVPVYSGLADPDHPLSRLLAALPAPATAEDPLYLVQAALLQTMS
jgi:ornithine carbamoyltransferase